MVNYPVLPVLASISIPATAFPSPGHVPEITYRLFAQLPRLAARSTSFSLPLRPPLFVSPSPFFLSFLSFFFLFFPFVSPLLLARLPGRSRPSPLRLVLLCSFRKRCTTWRITWEILNFHAPRPRFFPFSLSSFSLSLSARPFGLKRHDCWLFLRHPVITDEQESNWKNTFHFARFVKIYRKLSIFRFLDRLSRYWFDINIIDRVDEIDFISVGK